MRTRSRGSAGTATVELALMTPLLIGIMLGAFDFGRVSYVAIAVTGAAHAGAQYGSQNTGKAVDITGMRNAAQNHAPGMGITATPVTECRCLAATVVACTSTCASGMRVYASVTATRSFSTIVNYPGVPNFLTITRTARMRAQ